MVLVTYLNQLVSEGQPLDTASVEGACLRLRPVLMTAATTALGLLPLLFSSGTGSEVQRPLATVVVGGPGQLDRADASRDSRSLQVVFGSARGDRRAHRGRRLRPSASTRSPRGRAVAAGLRARRVASQGLEEYFLAGRSLSGWQAGLSMAATQFAADTPLLVTGLVATAGIFALWQLWIYALAFLLLGFVLAPSWRRAGVLTDAELAELRYGGRAATVLRGMKALYFGTLVNCIVSGLGALRDAGHRGALPPLESLAAERRCSSPCRASSFGWVSAWPWIPAGRMSGSTPPTT